MRSLGGRASLFFASRARDKAHRPSTLSLPPLLPSHPPPPLPAFSSTADIISAVEFDRDGTHLATGDRGGRVVLFEASAAGPSGRGGEAEAAPLDARPPPRPRGGGAPPAEYLYLTEFQSHEPEFDYLKSLEIEEKVNRVKWVPSGRSGGGGAGAHSPTSRLLLSTNDKTVKLWRVAERRVPTLAAGFDAITGAPLSAAAVAAASVRGGGEAGSTSCGAPGGVASAAGAGAPWSIAASSRAGEARAPPPPAGGKAGKPPPLGGAAAGGGKAGEAAPTTPAPPPPYTLAIPRVTAVDTVLAARCRRTFAGAHAYHVNSLSLCSDGETFLSADDLRIHLWHLDRPGAGAWVVVDMKPACMDDLTEVITAAEFHPADCAAFVYASSKGALRLADMRAAALCDRPALTLAPPEAGGGGGGEGAGRRAPPRCPPPRPPAWAPAPPRPPPRAPSSPRSSPPSRTSASWGATAAAWSPGTTWGWPCGTWPCRAPPWPPTRCTRPSAPAWPTCTRATASLTSLASRWPGTGPAPRRAATPPSSGSCPGGGGGGGEDGAPGQARRCPPGALLEASRDPQRLMRGAGGAGGTLASPAGPLRPGPPHAWPNSGGLSGGGAVVAAWEGGGGAAGATAPDPGADPEVFSSDYTAKMLHLAWHPAANVLAAAACNSLYLYHAP